VLFCLSLSGYPCAVQSWEDQQADRLRLLFGGWDVWTVRLATARRTIWCARPKGHPVATIQVWSPDELERAIGEQS
jgi:hypothetical protein